MTRSIVLETETVEKENECNWKKLDTAKKEDIVNDHFMPVGIRMHYEHERSASCCSFSSSSSTDTGSLCQVPRSHEGSLILENRPPSRGSYSSEWSSAVSI